MNRVFVRMFTALAVTTFASLLVVRSESLQAAIYGNDAAIVFLLVLEVALVIAVTAGLRRMSPAAANVCFYAYALVNGLTLSVVFFAYEIGAVYSAFAASALMFGAMAIYGATTHQDLSSWRGFLTMGLFGVILAGLLSLAFRSSALEAAANFVGVVIFVGLTAYDTQRIRALLADSLEVDHDEAIRKLTVFGALSLYLDFINLFLRLLRIMGSSRRR